MILSLLISIVPFSITCPFPIWIVPLVMNNLPLCSFVGYTSSCALADINNSSSAFIVKNSFFILERLIVFIYIIRINSNKTIIMLSVVTTVHQYLKSRLWVLHCCTRTLFIQHFLDQA